MIVAIDGPAGSGKSTVAKLLAARLGLHYLDTGAMYRCVALAALADGLDLSDEAAVADLASRVAITFEHDAASAVPTRVLLDGADVTLDIRTPAIDDAVSAVARLALVREAMVAQQRAVAVAGDLVAEGRDIGTVVFPDADVKVYLTASGNERARRRHAELSARGESIGQETVQSRMSARDEADSNREASPLAAADDAILIDTTGLGIGAVTDRIAALVEAVR